MRNLLIAFFVLFLPLQWGTAVVAAYCQHEEGPGAMEHIGHHAHHSEHQSSVLKAKGAQQGKAWDASCSADHEHSHCTHAIVQDSRLPEIFASGTDDSPYGAFVPDAPRDNLLRPPQRPLA
ncbi:hypothetical protein GPA27_18105 [Aromatoleum toluolicum]|uniref:Cobalt-zinc-cadmium resistance protein n=1 Tax=Aromatoleum toluolicum TaxID=90060 RepID=A0ABX1NJ08_9RHOO|nr:hypothetical protein [Aromatoleum toluolicum]NMF99296.1 hypothetical protein [Aromatoleum toluolicum]